jgi:hypothetical protein
VRQVFETPESHFWLINSGRAAAIVEAPEIGTKR